MCKSSFCLVQVICFAHRLSRLSRSCRKNIHSIFHPLFLLSFPPCWLYFGVFFLGRGVAYCGSKSTNYVCFTSSHYPLFKTVNVILLFQDDCHNFCDSEQDHGRRAKRRWSGCLRLPDSYFFVGTTICSILLYSSSASGIAIGCVPVTIIFRNRLAQVPFSIPALMDLRRFITGIALVFLSPSKRPFDCFPLHWIMDALSPSLFLFSTDRSALTNWCFSMPDFRSVLAIHCLAVGWIIARYNTGIALSGSCKAWRQPQGRVASEKPGLPTSGYRYPNSWSPRRSALFGVSPQDHHDFEIHWSKTPLWPFCPYVSYV